jgi:hypothetical protein
MMPFCISFCALTWAMLDAERPGSDGGGGPRACARSGRMALEVKTTHCRLAPPSPTRAASLFFPNHSHIYTPSTSGGVPYDDTHLRDRGPGVSRAATHWVEQTRRDLELVRRNPRGTTLEAMDNFGSDRTLHRRVKKWAEAEERRRAGPAGPRQQRQHTRGVTAASGTRPELENESNSWWEGDAAVAAAAAAEAAAANS